jgi:F-box protein 11
MLPSAQSSRHNLEVAEGSKPVEGSQGPKTNKNILKMSFLVDPNGDGTSCNKKIQDAIDKAQSDSVIKISHGLYKENLVIKNKALKLEAKDMNSEVYILGENGPSLLVDNSNDETVVLERLKFAHKGSSGKTNQSNSKDQSNLNPNIANSKTQLKSQKTRSMSMLRPSDTINPDSVRSDSKTQSRMETTGKSSSNMEKGIDKSQVLHYIQEVSDKLGPLDSPNTTCGIFIRNGTTIMRNCQINLNMIVKKEKKKAYIPAIVAVNNSTLNITDCELRGSNHYETVGVLVKGANLLMKECTITHFKMGGICVHLNENNTSKIINTRVTFNQMFGIQVIGKTLKLRRHGQEMSVGASESNFNEGEEPEVIKGCEIEKNEGPGLQIVTPNTCLVKNNTISYNKNGVEIISADPKLIDNNISKNLGNGVYIKCVESLCSYALVKLNTIRSNRENGVLCTGKMNRAKICYNPEISFNKLCGIKVEDQANPRILVNKITKNIFQGVLLVENSSAHIESNEISENIKANVAFGGDMSANTVICRNKILKGRCEGIFMIEAGNAYIRHNIIKENYDGIIMITSAPEVSNNEINENKNAGIIIMKDSRPKIYDNTFTMNTNVAIFVRDNSKFYRPYRNDPKSTIDELDPDLIRQQFEDRVMPRKIVDDPKKETKKDKENKKNEKEVGPDIFFFYGNTVPKNEDDPTSKCLALVVERPISDGKKIKQMNDFADNECRIPYTCREIKFCTLI